MIWNKLLPGVLTSVFGVIDKAVTDKDLAIKLKSDLNFALIEQEAKKLNAQAEIIVAEAKSGSWLTRTWRPLTMLTFTSLIVAHWLGFTAENLSESQVIALLDIVKVGLGGYVIGRSVEKGITEWKK